MWISNLKAVFYKDIDMASYSNLCIGDNASRWNLLSPSYNTRGTRPAFCSTEACISESIFLLNFSGISDTPDLDGPIELKMEKWPTELPLNFPDRPGTLNLEERVEQKEMSY